MVSLDRCGRVLAELIRQRAAQLRLVVFDIFKCDAFVVGKVVRFAALHCGAVARGTRGPLETACRSQRDLWQPPDSAQAKVVLMLHSSSVLASGVESDCHDVMMLEK